MNASCLDEKGRFKSCPYRVYTDEHICPNAQAKMEADFLHEMIYSMLDHLGYTEHDEKKVDELANVLHMVILDNPAVFAPVKEGQHENG